MSGWSKSWLLRYVSYILVHIVFGYYCLHIFQSWKYYNFISFLPHFTQVLNALQQNEKCRIKKYLNFDSCKNQNQIQLDYPKSWEDYFLEQISQTHDSNDEQEIIFFKLSLTNSTELKSNHCHLGEYFFTFTVEGEGEQQEFFVSPMKSNWGSESIKAVYSCVQNVCLIPQSIILPIQNYSHPMHSWVSQTSLSSGWIASTGIGYANKKPPKQTIQI